jgi:hypothetical protein
MRVAIISYACGDILLVPRFSQKSHLSLHFSILFHIYALLAGVSVVWNKEFAVESSSLFVAHFRKEIRSVSVGHWAVGFALLWLPVNLIYGLRSTVFNAEPHAERGCSGAGA